MLTVGPLLCSLVTALQVTAVTAGGDGGPKTRIRGINFTGEGCIGVSTLPSSGRHPGNWYGYDETAVDPSRQYNGRVYDPSTGFHDYGARLYWPEIGRFISADSYGGSPADPASLNRYAYVHNNPYKYTDPTGHSVVARGVSPEMITGAKATLSDPNSSWLSRLFARLVLVQAHSNPVLDLMMGPIGIIEAPAAEGAAVAVRALKAADLGLSGEGLARVSGQVIESGSTKIISVEMVEAAGKGSIPAGEIKGAFESMISSAKAAGVETLQIQASFANPKLAEFAASQAAKYGGMCSSSGGTETMTFLLGAAK